MVNNITNEEEYSKILDIDEIVHNPTRLAILIFLLSSRGKTSFTVIRKALGLTAGNLSSHITKLSQNELIEVEKLFIDAKPTTVISLNNKGSLAIKKYSSQMTKILNNMLETDL